MESILAGIAKYAAKFDTAAGWAAEETMAEKGFDPSRHSLHLGYSAPAEEPEMITRELINLYGFTSDPAIHEVRAVESVDGKARGNDAALFTAAIEGNRSAHKKLMDGFARESLDVAANDFGQLVLLFVKGQQPNYEFSYAGTSLIGAEKVLLIRYRESSGLAALHLKDGSKNSNAPLSGEIEARESDFAPLRITLTSARKNVRDEAEVDYILQGDDLLLPASIVYRRYVHDTLSAEDRSRFSGWHRVAGAR